MDRWVSGHPGQGQGCRESPEAWGCSEADCGEMQPLSSVPSRLGDSGECGQGHTAATAGGGGAALGDSGRGDQGQEDGGDSGAGKHSFPLSRAGPHASQGASCR